MSESPIPSHPLLGKTGMALLVMVAALAVPYATPKLCRFRVASPEESACLDPVAWVGGASVAWVGGAPPPPQFGVGGAPTTAPAPTEGAQALPPSENLATVNNALPDNADVSELPDIDPEVRATFRAEPIEDPIGHALDGFFERLARTARGDSGAVTRILYYGDSTIASDYISGTVRRRLQARFGDAGHGFILISNPWEWYFHNDVFHASDGEWKASRLAGPITMDGMYGLGGVSFASFGGGVAWFGSAGRGDFGRNVGRFDLYYLEQPGGGEVEMSASGGMFERFSTRGATRVSRVHSLHVPDGASRLTVRAAGGGLVRLFGVALERDRPGVVCDALGSHAAMAVYWQRQNRDHWREQFELRDPALVILEYGTNESDLWRLDRAQYEQALSNLVDEIHNIAGGASVLVVAPPDRAELRAGRLVTKPVILDLVTIQRRVALAHAAAFWSTFDAMGGEGSMARWYRTRPQLAGGDVTHPTPLGAEILGDMLTDALTSAFEKSEHGASGAPSAPSAPGKGALTAGAR